MKEFMLILAITLSCVLGIEIGKREPVEVNESAIFYAAACIDLEPYTTPTVVIGYKETTVTCTSVHASVLIEHNTGTETVFTHDEETGEVIASRVVGK